MGIEFYTYALYGEAKVSIVLFTLLIICDFLQCKIVTQVPIVFVGLFVNVCFTNYKIKPEQNL